MKRLITMAAAVLCFATTTSAFAKDAAPGAAPAPAPGVQGEFTRNLGYAGDKLVQLAEAIPAEKYTWRPSEGARSVAEVCLHAAGGNYWIPTFIGVKAPEGFDSKTFETSTTQREAIVEHLKKSLAHVNAAAAAMKDADLNTKVKWFMGETTKRELLFFLAAHNHEHLGQMIAYARMNGVTPPWSMKE